MCCQGLYDLILQGISCSSFAPGGSHSTNYASTIATIPCRRSCSETLWCLISGNRLKLLIASCRLLQEACMVLDLCHVLWFMMAIAILTSSIGPMKLWEEWTWEQSAARRSLKNPKADFVMHLLGAAPWTPSGSALLSDESRLIINAGSDTATSNLMFIFVQFDLHPKHQQALRK